MNNKEIGSGDKRSEEEREMKEFVEAMWEAVNNPVILPEVVVTRVGDPKDIPEDASLAWLLPDLTKRKNDGEQEDK